MDALTHCPSCQAVLRVPSNAEGQPIRCPACKHISRVPAQQDLKDETISTWIEMDVESLLSERQEQAEQRNRPRQGNLSSAATAELKSNGSDRDAMDDSNPPQKSGVHSKKPVEIEDETLTPQEQEEIFRRFDPSFATQHHQNDTADRYDILSDRPLGKRHGVAGRSARQDVSDPGEETRLASEGTGEPSKQSAKDSKAESCDDSQMNPEGGAGPSGVSLVPKVNLQNSFNQTDQMTDHEEDTSRVISGVGELEVGETSGASRGGEEGDSCAVTASPQDIAQGFEDSPMLETTSATTGHVGPSGLRLQAKRVSAMGIHFSFDARCLEVEGFRLSMPVRCVFCGDTDRKHLIARPLVFLDQCMTKSATVESVSSPHECRELGDRHPRQWTRQMGRLSEMPRPFDQPVAYYVSHHYAHLSLHCETRPAGDGGMQCELLIPDAEVGLQWMMRVNGVCGEDYLQLEQEVSLLHGSGWKSLSEQCRQRLSIWCKLKPHEQFRGYFNDADFNRKDEGLAGLVLTDQRIIFCKYHARGRLPINAEHIELICKHADCFVELYVRMRGRTSPMLKLRRDDYERFTRQFDELEKQMQVTEA